MARGRHPARIHIDPPDEQIAAKYYLNWDGREIYRQHHRFPFLTSPGIFGNNHPFEIDFGCGTGMFACNRAGENPDSNILGIDKSFKSIYYAVDSAANQKLCNIKFLRGDFGVMMQLLQPATVNHAYYLFPTPPLDYHNERANSRRYRFFESIFKALIPGGKFHFVSDSKVYFKNVNSIIREVSDSIAVHTSCDENDFITGYHQKWEEEGRDIWSITVEKPAFTRCK